MNMKLMKLLKLYEITVKGFLMKNLIRKWPTNLINLPMFTVVGARVIRVQLYNYVLVLYFQY